MLTRVFKKRNYMNTPSSIKTKNQPGSYNIYAIAAFFFFSVLLLFFSKSAHVGLRLPDCTHIYRSKDFSSHTYILYQGGEEGRERRKEIYTSLPLLLTPQKGKEIPQQGELCAKYNGRLCPQTDGSAQANVLLVFLRDLL